MLVSAAVCPHPPAIAPAVSRGAAGALAELRLACVESVQALAAIPHDVLVCVGAGPRTTRWGANAGGTLRRFGVDAAFGAGDLVLPPALTIAAYLVEEAGIPSPDIFQSIAADAAPESCRDLGKELARVAERVALLVMGDGSAKRTKHSPGYFDERAADFDADVARALSQPDPGSLLRIAPALADELWVAGRPSWQALAGALGSSSTVLKGALRYDSAPFGVGYFVVQLATPD